MSTALQQSHQRVVWLRYMGTTASLCIIDQPTYIIKNSWATHLCLYNYVLFVIVKSGGNNTQYSHLEWDTFLQNTGNDEHLEMDRTMRQCLGIRRAGCATWDRATEQGGEVASRDQPKAEQVLNDQPRS